MDTIADTMEGRLRGRYLDGVCAFKGVRYGESTAGKHRFASPRRVKNWSGIRDALLAGPCAPQLPCAENTDPFFSWYSAVDRVSEDCLFLNLYTPALTGRRPVMVWLHGGGWTSYSGTAPGFEGNCLSRTEDVVVVSINHRLGIFGHLRLDQADARFSGSGNNGLHDIVLALQWLRDNAECFGGDPGNVTIFGESGGGSKVAALMAMRGARGLFHRAVIQSTGSGASVATREEAGAVSARLARVLDLRHLDISALQRLPMQALLAASADAPPARAMIDGLHIEDHPYDGILSATACDIPLMVGCTRTECSYYMRGNDHNFALDRIDVVRRLANFFSIPTEKSRRILECYQDVYSGVGSSELLMLACSDYMFKRSTYGIADRQSRSARAPVFAYHFEWQTPVENGRMRSPHTAEVPFIFGTVPAAAACVGAGSNRLMRAVMASWGAFARSGNPANSFVPDWSAYDVVRRQTMCLDDECRLESDPGGLARSALEGLPFYDYGKSVLPMIAD